jgi:hypothetical protein
MSEKTFTAADAFVNETTRVARTLVNGARDNGKRVEVSFSTPTMGGSPASAVKCTLYYEPPPPPPLSSSSTSDTSNNAGAAAVAAALLAENAALRTRLALLQKKK